MFKLVEKCGKKNRTQTEVLYDVEYFDGLLQASVFVFLGYDEVYVYVCVDKVTVGRPPHGALNTHQAVLFRPLEHRPRIKVLRVARIFYVGPYPTYILAPESEKTSFNFNKIIWLCLPSKSPLPQTHPPHIQPLGTAAPQKHETPLGGHLAHVQVHDVVPGPELHVGGPHRPLVLLQGWFNEDDVELAVEVLQVVGGQVAL